MNTNDFVYAESLYMHEYTVRIQTLYVWDTKAFPVVLVKCIDSKEMTLFPSSCIPYHDTMPANAIMKTLCL